MRPAFRWIRRLLPPWQSLPIIIATAAGPKLTRAQLAEIDRRIALAAVATLRTAREMTKQDQRRRG